MFICLFYDDYFCKVITCINGDYKISILVFLSCSFKRSSLVLIL